MTKIDYIIPTWNSEATLENTLASIERYGSPNEIIIVDRDSSDRTLVIARRYNCRIIQSNRSLGAARREGALAAHTELISFVDADVELLESWQNLLQIAFRGDYKDAGAFGAYYEGQLPNVKKWPLKLDGGNGAFGCIITRRSHVIDCKELDKFSSAEDRIFARFLAEKGLKWYIFPVAVLHHQSLSGISYYLRLRWLGAGLRVEDGFRPGHVKKILGGAIFGIRMNDLDISYIENWKMRWNYFIGYIRYKKYYEINRNDIGLQPLLKARKS
ncbi:Glycosyltransferase AglI [uncultured archaeon]|nr:Glycosyltransferase AglI [uncultured archaeon]